jgi:hypothetical protein
MKNILLLFTTLISFNLMSQRYNLDYDYNMKESGKTWVINTEIVGNQVIFNWEKDIVTSITIKSLDNDIFFPRIDAFMNSQLVLNSLAKGRYKLQFLDDCNAIMDIKEIEIK